MRSKWASNGSEKYKPTIFKLSRIKMLLYVVIHMEMRGVWEDIYDIHNAPEMGLEANEQKPLTLYDRQ